MKNLTEKVAVVTGAAAGIGKALAEGLAARGAKLALCDKNAVALQALSQSLSADGIEVFTQAFGVEKHEEVHAFADAVVEHYGQVDLVINNAGVGLEGISVLDLDYGDLEWIVGINFYGMVYGTKAFLPYLIAQPEAAVVNISSIFGIVGTGLNAPYCSTKFAIRGFTEALRMELYVSAPHVTAISVHPGGIKTEIANTSRTPKNCPTSPEKRALMLKEFNEKALVMPPSEAARIILDGIQRKKTRILVGKDARILDRIARLFPTGYTRQMLKRVNIQHYWE